jgi:hypothetical protein
VSKPIRSKQNLIETKNEVEKQVEASKAIIERYIVR